MLWDEPKIFFLERRYFFSIILSEFLKNRVALQKCCVLICQKYKKNESYSSCDNYDIFMSDVKWCGHDSRGNITYSYTSTGEKVVLDEIPLVADRYLEMR